METKNTKNGKILFVIQDYYQYLAYVRSLALRDIKDRIIFLVNPILTSLNFDVPEDQVIPYAYPSEKDILHRYIFNIHSWMNRHRDKGFLIRTLYFKPRQKNAYRILSLPIVYHIVKFYFLTKAHDKKLDDIVKKINPSIVILPSHMFEGITYELIRIARQVRIPSFMIIDNWDTLVYRTIFTYFPDYLGVWSSQQLEQAVTVKRMPRDKIFILGTPKFINYLNSEQKKLPSLYPFRYVLYVGVFDEYDELSVLKKIDESIEKHSVPLKIVFRPTATQFPRKCPDVFFEYDYKHIILDVNARSYYKKGTSWDFSKDKFDPKQFPDPNYNLSLLQNAEFIICPVSTMLLEATLLGKKIYLIAYDDGIHQFNPKWTLEATTHYQGLERLENIRVIKDEEDIEKIFSPGDQLKKNNGDPIDINWFVAKEATVNYPANLKKVIGEILTL